MADQFFNQPEPQVPVEEKIKVGEEEYTPEELQKLVGLGKIGVEAEEKYQTKIDKVWPNLQRTINEKKELEQKIGEYEQKIQQQTQTQTPVTPEFTEELRRQALEQAEKLGIGPKSVENIVRQVVREENSARDLLNDINGVLGNAETNGQPMTTVKDILDYMTETGIKNPQIAYEQMFKDDLMKLEVEKLSQLRRQGMVTTTQSMAGGKQPTTVKITRDNLRQLVEEELNKGSQAF